MFNRSLPFTQPAQGTGSNFDAMASEVFKASHRFLELELDTEFDPLDAWLAHSRVPGPRITATLKRVYGDMALAKVFNDAHAAEDEACICDDEGEHELADEWRVQVQALKALAAYMRGF